MRTEIAEVGARGVDTVVSLDAPKSKTLKGAGIDFAMQYLGTVSPSGIDAILNAGLAFMPITYANRYNGPQAVTQLKTLALPVGCTVWLDVEDEMEVPITELKSKINNWATAILNAGYMPGMYVGAGVPLTSLELYQLKVVRYWHSVSRVTDRNGSLAEPGCGWVMHQLHPPNLKSWRDIDVIVDLDIIQHDYRGRLPSWVVAS